MKYILALLTAILLAVILFPVGFIMQIWRGGTKYLFKIAMGIDQLGNVVCATLFNRTLIKSTGYKFGYEDEVISSVLGKNERDGTLSGAGALICKLLNAIDKGHAERNIEEFEKDMNKNGRLLKIILKHENI